VVALAGPHKCPCAAGGHGRNGHGPKFFAREIEHERVIAAPQLGQRFGIENLGADAIDGTKLVGR
jgi:hypothetical protein